MKIEELNLFDDQHELFDKIREGMKRFRTNLVVSPTGSGKTAIATHMMKSANAKDKKVIFTVPRRNLMEQTSNTFEKYGVSHSFIAAGKSFNPYANSYIGTIDSMARRIKNLPFANLLVVDETHFGDTALGEIIKHYENMGAWVLGLSASPWRLNGRGLGVYYKNMILGKSTKWLIENKRLSDYKYFCGKTKPDLSGLRVAGGDYIQHEMQDFMEHQGAIIGDCVSDYQKRCMGNIHIVRCASIKHSQMVAASFNAAGIPAAHVDGKTDEGELKRIFRAFAMRQIKVVTFCDLIGFGFDLAQIAQMDVCIESQSDLKPSKSLAAQLQYWGRALRYKDKPAIICDHVNNYVEHGFPDDERAWTLADRVQTKISSDERALPAKQCEQCFFTHRPAPKCPECGFVYPIKSREIDEIDGELVELDRSKMRQGKQLDPKKMQEAIDKMVEGAVQRGVPHDKAVVWAAKKYTRQLAAG